MPGPACRFCGESLPAAAMLCRGCGATLARRSVSVWPLFLFLPLLALTAVLAAAIQVELPPRSIAIAFPVAWLTLALLYVAWTRRAAWRRGETLVLTAPADSAPVSGWAALLTSQWSIGATAAAVVGVLWITASGQPLDPANALILSLDGSDRSRTAVLASAGSASTSSMSVPSTGIAPAVLADARAMRPPAAVPPAPSAPIAVAAAMVPTQNEEPVSKSEIAVAAPVSLAPEAASAEADEQAVVLTAQKMLDGLGYSVGGIDGKPGSKTRIAVRSFRERQGLGGGETIDAALVAALESATAQRQAAIRQARQQQASARPNESAEAVARAAPVNAFSPAGSEPGRMHRVSDPAPSSAPLRLHRGSSVQSSAGQAAPGQAAPGQAAPVQSAKVPASSATIGF